MIVFRLIRMAMLEGCCLANLSVGKISFTRALTETRQLLKFLPAAAKVSLRASIRATYAQCRAQYRVKSKPNRRYPGDRQEYRRKSRGPEKRRPSGRKYKAASPPPQADTRKDVKGLIFLLSERH
jgi:CelD/BcsL family acetyltransferase involved in cellulose biosynthesis